MGSAITFETDCKKKLITIRWKVTITGLGRTPARVKAIKDQFAKSFNPTPPLRIGACKVKFVADFQEKKGDVPRRLSGKRDFIRIGVPGVGRGGGGGNGFTIRGGQGKPSLVSIAPRQDTGAFAAWELINEIGHAFGLVDRNGTLAGEWNADEVKKGVGADGKPAKVVTKFSVKDRDVAAIIAAAPLKDRLAVLACCDRRAYEKLLAELKPGGGKKERQREEKERQDEKRRARRLLRRIWELERRLPPLGKPFSEPAKKTGGR